MVTILSKFCTFNIYLIEQLWNRNYITLILPIAVFGICARPWIRKNTRNDFCQFFDPEVLLIGPLMKCHDWKMFLFRSLNSKLPVQGTVRGWVDKCILIPSSHCGFNLYLCYLSKSLIIALKRWKGKVINIFKDIIIFLSYFYVIKKYKDIRNLEKIKKIRKK